MNDFIENYIVSKTNSTHTIHHSQIEGDVAVETADGAELSNLFCFASVDAIIADVDGNEPENVLIGDDAIGDGDGDGDGESAENEDDEDDEARI